MATFNRAGAVATLTFTYLEALMLTDTRADLGKVIQDWLDGQVSTYRDEQLRAYIAKLSDDQVIQILGKGRVVAL